MARPTQLPDLLDSATSLSPEFLRQAVEDYTHSLLALQEDFEASLQAQDSELLAAVDPHLEAARQSLQEQAELAQELLGAIQSGADMRSWAAAVRAGTRRSNDALAAYREAALIACGPTGLAGVNLILRTADYLLNEPEADCWDRLSQQIQAEVQRAENALAQSPQSPPLRDALGNLEAVLQQMLVKVEKRSLPLIQHLTGDLVGAAEDLEIVLEQLKSRDELSQGPTPYARLNLLINLGREFLSGHRDEEELLESCQLLQQDISSWRSQCATIARRLAASPLVTERAQLVDRLFEDFDLELVEMFQAAQRDDLEGTDERGQMLGQLWDELTLAQKELEKAIEIQGQTPCVRCGHYNAQEKRNCQQCGAILPAVAQERSHAVNLDDTGRSEVSPVTATEMTENLQRILEAVEQFQEGALAVDELHAEVAWMAGLLQEARKLLPAPTETSETSEAPAEPTASPVGLYLEGLQDMEAGLAFLRQLNDPSERTLSDMGMGLVWEGAGKVQTAMAQATTQA